MASKRIILTFEEGWPVLQEGIDKVIGSLEGDHIHPITSEEYMKLYTTVFNIAQPNLHSPGCQKLYDQYKKTFEDYISSKVLPSLLGKKDEILLQQLIKCWNNHMTITRWLSRFYHYLDRYFTPTKKLSLQQVSHLTFYELVYGEMNNQIRDAVISMIDRERQGEQIDQALVKKALDIYVEMGDGSKKLYKKDFEETMFKNTSVFYSERASDWITSESYKDYMLKVDQCLKHESDIVSCYLPYRSKDKLEEILQHELLTIYGSKLEEKKHLDYEAA